MSSSELANDFYREYAERMIVDVEYNRDEVQRFRYLDTHWSTMTVDELADSADYVTTKVLEMDKPDELMSEFTEIPDGMVINTTAIANFAAIVRHTGKWEAEFEDFLERCKSGRIVIEYKYLPTPPGDGYRYVASAAATVCLLVLAVRWWRR